MATPQASPGPAQPAAEAPPAAAPASLEHSRDAVFVNERTVLGGACSFQQIGGKPTGMLGCSGGSQPGGWARSWVGPATKRQRQGIENPVADALPAASGLRGAARMAFSSTTAMTIAGAGLPSH